MKHLTYEDEVSLLYLENERDFVTEISKKPKKTVKIQYSEIHRLNDDFVKTNSFQQAEILRRNGCYELYTQVKHKINKHVKYKNKKQQKTQQINSIKGSYPNVPRALMNHPMSMIKNKQQKKEYLSVSIFTGVSFKHTTTAEEITSFGSLILSLIDRLESNNIKVNLFTLEAHFDNSLAIKKNYILQDSSETTNKIDNILSIGEKKKFKTKYVTTSISKIPVPDKEDCSVDGSIFKIKRAEEPLNMLKLSYYLMHPSYLRRHLFKLQENSIYLKDLTDYSYGEAGSLAYAKAEYLLRQNFENVVVFTDSYYPEFCNIETIEENLDKAYNIVVEEIKGND